MMRVRRLYTVGLLALALSALALPAASAEPPRDTPRAPATQLHLALGDSVAAGVGATDPDDTGYVPRLYDRLRDDLDCWPARAPRCRSLHLVNASRGGATTVSLIAGQLPDAVALLTARNTDPRPNNDVRVVTVTIGGNDLFGPAVEACQPNPLAPACAAVIEAQLQQVAANLPGILSALIDAAGDDATVAVMTYYNPLDACVLAGLAPLADLALEGGILPNGTVPPGLNDIIRESATATGAVVADTFGALDGNDLVGGQDCLHPDDSGHGIIADILAEAILAG